MIAVIGVGRFPVRASVSNAMPLCVCDGAAQAATVEPGEIREQMQQERCRVSHVEPVLFPRQQWEGEGGRWGSRGKQPRTWPSLYPPPTSNPKTTPRDTPDLLSCMLGQQNLPRQLHRDARTTFATAAARDNGSSPTPPLSPFLSIFCPLSMLLSAGVYLVLQFFYVFLDGALPPTPDPLSTTTAVKVLIDQFVQAPIFTVIIFGVSVNAAAATAVVS